MVGKNPVLIYDFCLMQYCRFTKGLYKMLLDKGYVKSYIVIDLRCSNSVPRTRQDDNLWHVSFSDDFLKATVRSANACYSNTLQLKQG